MSAAPKPLIASERVRLYLTLVPYLLERGQVSLAEAAAEFDVTPAQLRTMVEKLTVIGLPGDSGYWQQPHEMFDIDWDLLDQQDIIEITNDVALRRVPRFTAREAAALLAGLQLVASVPDVAGSGLVTGLIAKLSRGAADAPAAVVVATDAVDDVREVVSRALRDDVAVAFTYQAPDSAAMTRTVDPVQVLITNGQWYLQGWCHLRQAMRTFHLDRVSDAHVTSIPSTHRGDPAPEPFVGGGTDDGNVTVEVPARLAPLLNGFHLHEAAASDTVSASIRLADPRGIKRLAGRFGGRMEVLAPSIGRAATRDWAAAGLALYGEPDPETAG
jgi:proteasome accessory factor C